MGELADSFVTVIGAISIFTNGVLLFILLTDPLHYFKSSTTYFIISLTVADLLTGANSCVYGVNRFWPFTEQFTMYLLALFWATIQASFLTLLAMSVERFLIVKYPFDCRSWITKRRVCMSIAFIWLLSTVLGGLILLPPQRAMYVQFCIYTEFFISVFLITGMYAFILLSVRRSQKSLGKAGNYHRGGSQYRGRTTTRAASSKSDNSEFSMRPLGIKSDATDDSLLDGRPLLPRKAQPQYRQVKASSSSISDDVSCTLQEQTVMSIGDEMMSQSQPGNGVTSQSQQAGGIASQSQQSGGITSQSQQFDNIASQSRQSDGITIQSLQSESITSQSQHGDDNKNSSNDQTPNCLDIQPSNDTHVRKVDALTDNATRDSTRDTAGCQTVDKLNKEVANASTGRRDQSLKYTNNQFHDDIMVTGVRNGSSVASLSRFNSSGDSRRRNDVLVTRGECQLLIESPEIGTGATMTKQPTITKQQSMSTIQENKLTAVVLLLVGVLVLTVLPYLLVAQLYLGYHLFGGNQEPQQAFIKFMDIYFPIELLNFAVNPLIYAWRLPQYRRTLVYFLSSRKNRPQRGSSVLNRSGARM